MLIRLEKIRDEDSITAKLTITLEEGGDGSKGVFIAVMFFIFCASLVVPLCLWICHKH